MRVNRVVYVLRRGGRTSGTLDMGSKPFTRSRQTRVFKTYFDTAKLKGKEKKTCCVSTKQILQTICIFTCTIRKKTTGKGFVRVHCRDCARPNVASTECKLEQVLISTQVESKVTVGLVGVLLVLLSVASSVGLLSYMQLSGDFNTKTEIETCNKNCNGIC